MTYQDIRCYSEINSTDPVRVAALVDSMLTNGWTGLPILTFGDRLLTGSHRLAALRVIDQMVSNFEIDSADVLDDDIAEDVSDIVNANYSARAEQLGYDPDIDCANIGWLLSGSRFEGHKSEISEW